MANPNLEIKVSIESTIHKALKRVLEEVASKHGLQVMSMHVNWIEVRSTGGLCEMCQVHEIVMETKSHGDNS